MSGSKTRPWVGQGCRTADFDSGLLAYRHSLGRKAGDRQYLRAQDRQFFIGFARAWRSKLSDVAMRARAAGSDHAPENFRVATVRNLDARYDAFDVEPGQALFLKPGARVRIW